MTPWRFNTVHLLTDCSCECGSAVSQVSDPRLPITLQQPLCTGRYVSSFCLLWQPITWGLLTVALHMVAIQNEWVHFTMSVAVAVHSIRMREEKLVVTLSLRQHMWETNQRGKLSHIQIDPQRSLNGSSHPNWPNKANTSRVASICWLLPLQRSCFLSSLTKKREKKFSSRGKTSQC